MTGRTRYRDGKADGKAGQGQVRQKAGGTVGGVGLS